MLLKKRHIVRAKEVGKKKNNGYHVRWFVHVYRRPETALVT